MSVSEHFLVLYFLRKPIANNGIGLCEAATISRKMKQGGGGQKGEDTGVSIPVFALTDKGKRPVLNSALHLEDRLVAHWVILPHLRADRQPELLIKGMDYVSLAG